MVNSSNNIDINANRSRNSIVTKPPGMIKQENEETKLNVIILKYN